MTAVKNSLINEFTFFQTLWRLFRSAQIVKKCGRFFLDFNFFLDCTHVKKGKREFVFVCSRPQSIKRHIRRFHVVVVQWMYVKDVYQKAWCTSCKTVVLLIKPVVFWRCRRLGDNVVKAPFTWINLSSSLTSFTMFKFILKLPGNGSPVMYWRYSDDGLCRRFWRTERCRCNTVRSCSYWGCFVQGNFWSTVRVSNATNMRGPCEKVHVVTPRIQYG